MLFDRAKLSASRSRILNGDLGADFLLQFSANDIIDKLTDIKISNSKDQVVVEVGARNGNLTSKLLKLFPGTIATEISQDLLNINPSSLKLLLDEDSDDFSLEGLSKYVSAKPNIIISMLNLHWINDLSTFLSKIKNILSDDGLFIASFFGGDTLLHLRYKMLEIEERLGLSHRPYIMPFIKSEDIYNIAHKAGLNNIIVDTQKIEVEYKSIYSLMKDLQAMGEVNVLSRELYPLDRQLLEVIKAPYNFIETFNIVTVTSKCGNY